MLECGLRAVVLHDKGVVWNYYAECTADSRRINTKRKISDISYIKSSEDVGIERFYLTQHGAVVTMTFSFVLKKSIPQGAYENVIIGYLPSDIKPVQETWPLMGEQGSNKSHQGRVKSNGQIELWCWGADALDKDHIFSCTAVFLVNT